MTRKTITVNLYCEDRAHPYYATERDRDGLLIEVQRYSTEKRIEAREIMPMDEEHCHELCPQFSWSETSGAYICRLRGYAHALKGTTRTWQCKESEGRQLAAVEEKP